MPPLKWIASYSYRKASTGFALAVLIIVNNNIKTENINKIQAGITTNHQPISILKAKDLEFTNLSKQI